MKSINKAKRRRKTTNNLKVYTQQEDMVKIKVKYKLQIVKPKEFITSRSTTQKILKEVLEAKIMNNSRWKYASTNQNKEQKW